MTKTLHRLGVHGDPMKKEKPPKKLKASPKPKLALVVPFPEDLVVRDRDFENLIRRLRKAKRDGVKEIVVLGFWDDGSFYQTSNGVNRNDALYLMELGRLDVMGLLTVI